MCGLTGWYNRTALMWTSSRLLRMAEAIVHRGPDDGGHLSVSGHQPMADISRRVVVTYMAKFTTTGELPRELEHDFGVVFCAGFWTPA